MEQKKRKTKFTLNSLIRSRYFTIFFLLILIVFVLGLSYTVLLKQSLRLDEAQSLWQSSHSVTGILKVIGMDVHVPFFHYILHFWQLFMGNDIEIARIIPLAFFVASIPAIYLLGKVAFNKKIGLFATLLFAISPFMNWYGNELRMYTMLAFFTILNQLFFIRIIKYNKKYDWYGYAVVSLCGIFTHYFFFFNLITQAIYYLINRKAFSKGSFQKFITTAIFLFICFLPWIIYVIRLGGTSNSQPLLIRPSSVDFFNTYSQFIFGFQEDTINTVILSLWPITIILGFLALKKTKRFEPITLYFLFAALLPIILAFLLSISVRPLFVTRYLVVSLPALYILITVFFATYKKALSLIMHGILVLAMLATLAIQLVNVNTPVKEDYKDVSAYLSENATSQDIIIISAPFTIYPIEYYYKGSAGMSTLPIWHREVTGSIPPFSPDNMVTEVKELQDKHQYAWVVLSYDQGYEKDIKDYFDNHYEVLTKKSFSPGLHLYQYKLRYDTDVKK